jgi:hypothetical protein
MSSTHFTVAGAASFSSDGAGAGISWRKSVMARPCGRGGEVRRSQRLLAGEDEYGHARYTLSTRACFSRYGASSITALAAVQAR